jgi:hypothetical protein
MLDIWRLNYDVEEAFKTAKENNETVPTGFHHLQSL